MSSTKMLWKVCGMKEEANIRQVAMLRPDFMGFIFYKDSPRYVGDDFPATVMSHLGGIKKTGVFVNQTTPEIIKKVAAYQLDYVQLHGHEGVDQVEELSRSVKVIKVVPGNDLPAIEILRSYEPFITYWLIDTRTSTLFGGTGQKFDWNILKELDLQKGIILSGGIGVEEAAEAVGLQENGVVGIDVNSRAELAPGRKNVDTLKLICDELYG